MVTSTSSMDAFWSPAGRATKRDFAVTVQQSIMLNVSDYGHLFVHVENVCSLIFY